MRKLKFMKLTIAAILFLYIAAILFCLTYVRLTRDWCQEQHDRCCQIYRPGYHDEHVTPNKDMTEHYSINSINYLKLSHVNMKDYVISGVKLDEFKFPLNSMVCGDNSVFLLAVVPSKPSNFDERQAIRETWGSRFKDGRLKLVFLTGLADNITNKQITKEQEINLDVVQASFVDSYKNLTLKTVSMLQWKKQFCSQAQFLLKIDDDVFLHTNNLLSRLHSLQNEDRFILGFTGIGEEPYRNSSNKWHITYEDYPFQRFPTFVHGPSYVISSDLVGDLYHTARHKSRIHLEDVYVTGLSAHVAGASHVGRCGFSVGQRDLADWFVSDAIVTAHEYSPDKLRDLWNELEAWKYWIPFVKIWGKIVGY